MTVLISELFVATERGFDHDSPELTPMSVATDLLSQWDYSFADQVSLLRTRASKPSLGIGILFDHWSILPGLCRPYIGLIQPTYCIAVTQ